jgi:hypothetical protein
MQERRARRLHRAPQRQLDRGDVVEVLAVPQIDDQMAAGVAQTVALDEAIAARDRLARLDLHLGSDAVRRRFGVHPNLGKRVVRHRSPPQTSNKREGWSYAMCALAPPDCKVESASRSRRGLDRYARGRWPKPRPAPTARNRRRPTMDSASTRHARLAILEP